MAKFNSNHTIRTANKEGHAAYDMNDKSKLVTQVLTSFFNESKFYGDNSEDMQKIIVSVIREDPEFVSNLAVFSRRVFNMRSVSHVLTAYLAHENEGKSYVRDTVKGVSLRGDDLTEIMAFYLSTFGKPIPNSLKKGINDVIVGFDEYTLAKYKGSGKSVKMRDLLCLCRPTPKNDEQAVIFKRCLENTLKTPLTWETELSANGNNSETWEKLIDSGKVGYMALLRNLSNIIKANPENIDKVYAKIQNSEAVRKSKQLPFRYLSAYKTIKPIASKKAFDALENAVDAAVNNLPNLSGKTIIAVDVSGSMSSLVSGKSDIRCCEIAMMLGVIANRICEDSEFYTFSTSLEKYAVSTRSGIVETTFHNCNCGGGTDMSLIFSEMINKRIKADRIIILSDNMCNAGLSFWNHTTVQSLADKYRRRTNNDLWVHAIDLQGYGTQQFHGAKTNIIAGWSEKIFDFILLAEQGEGKLIDTIKNYKW
ncbi:MAG: TROVE domain-containing protein [Ruminococcus sp.]|nr:TROVE domain-containing protein [Ruminococcus sp.]